MKYQIRKTEQVTIWRSTKPIELDDSAFRDLEENPYTGNSEEEFVRYISELDEIPSDLDFDSQDALQTLADADMEEIGSSAAKGEHSWLEIGETDAEYYKSGGFRVIATSAD